MCSFVLRFLRLENLKFEAHWVVKVDAVPKNTTQCEKF